MNTFSWADYVVFGGMLMVSALIGLYQWIFQLSSATQFITGGGDIPTVPVALSMLAGFLSSITLMGQPAEVYMYGAQQWLFGLATFLLIPLIGYYMVPFFREKNYFSAYQYFGERFNRKFQFLASVLFTFQMVLYLSLALYAPALAMNQVTGMNTMMVVTIMYAVCVFYTTVGGIKAVIWTDTFQVVVIFVSMAAILMKGTIDIGGLDVIWERNAAFNRTSLFNFDTDITERYTFWSSLIGSGFLHMSTYGGNQLQIQRYLSVRSNKEAVKMLWINSVGWSLVVLMCVYAGMLVFATYIDCDPLASGRIEKPDQIFPLYVMETLYMYPGFPGLFISGIFSAGLSTVSTGINSLAAIWFSELEGTQFRKSLSEKSSGMVVKLLALTFGIFSYVVVFLVPYMGGLVPLAVSLSSIFAGSLLGIFFLGMFFPSANTWGATAALLSSTGFLSWLVVGSSIAERNGQLVHPALPSSTAGCSSVDFDKAPQVMIQEGELAIWPYRISYAWYCLIAITWTTIVGLGVSWLANRFTNKSSERDQIPDQTDLTISNLLLNEKEIKIVTKQ